MESPTEGAAVLPAQGAMGYTPDLDTPCERAEAGCRRQTWPPSANSHCTLDQGGSGDGPEPGEFQDGHPRHDTPSRALLTVRYSEAALACSQEDRPGAGHVLSKKIMGLYGHAVAFP